MQESSKIGKCENVKTGVVVKFDATVKVETIDFCLKKKQTDLEIKLQVNDRQKVILFTNLSKNLSKNTIV